MRRPLRKIRADFSRKNAGVSDLLKSLLPPPFLLRRHRRSEGKSSSNGKGGEKYPLVIFFADFGEFFPTESRFWAKKYYENMFFAPIFQKNRIFSR